jgi:hypothetical protein
MLIIALQDLYQVEVKMRVNEICKVMTNAFGKYVRYSKLDYRSSISEFQMYVRDDTIKIL